MANGKQKVEYVAVTRKAQQLNGLERFSAFVEGQKDDEVKARLEAAKPEILAGLCQHPVSGNYGSFSVPCACGATFAVIFNDLTSVLGGYRAPICAECAPKMEEDNSLLSIEELLSI